MLVGWLSYIASSLVPSNKHLVEYPWTESYQYVFIIPTLRLATAPNLSFSQDIQVTTTTDDQGGRMASHLKERIQDYNSQARGNRDLLRVEGWEERDSGMTPSDL
jgi:hypothetical protein